MDAQRLKQGLWEAVEARREDIVGIGEEIMGRPELGFKEFRTAGLVAEVFGSLELPHQTGLGITGVKARLSTGRPGPTIAILGELDSLLVADHPRADPETGAAHACGHNAQIAGLMGAAMALVDCGAAERLAGEIVFFAVPAEEYVEMEYRLGLVRQGQIEFLGGKPELVRLGHFDDVDLAVMIHTSSREDSKVQIAASSNGCVAKLIRFIGRAAHAGGAPEKGINALNAAMLALAAIHAQRETFRDEDAVRVHPIITKGGDLVNVVPAEVKMETYVRGRTTEAILDANEKVDRALRAGAMALNAQVEIQTLPGYLPLVNDVELAALFERNAEALFGAGAVKRIPHQAGSTDMGDLSHLMPALHPSMAGASGDGHSVDWHIACPEDGYLAPAKSLAALAVDLLWDDAGEARRIIERTPPRLKKDEYLAYQRGLARTELYPGE